MNKPEDSISTQDIPAKVFNHFIDAIEKAGTAPEVVANLRKALDERAFTDAALRKAIFDKGSQ